MNIDAKLLNKILADQIQKQQQKKKITYYNQESFQVHKDVQHTQVNVIHKKKRQNHRIISRKKTI